VITPGQFFRILSIQRTLIRHGVDEILLTTPLLRSLGFTLYLLPWNWRRRSYGPRAERIRRVLEELGPIFVKFGQILSTRRDLLPDDIAIELSKLQDKVPPFPGSQAREIIERSLGQPLEQSFLSFSEEPLASASIAQVHAARLRDGKDVIVKVVRPGIRRAIERDIALMYTIAGMVERYWKEGKRLKPSGVVAEFEKTILDELDLMREAANASQLKRNFRDSNRIYVPGVVWDLTRREIMVMERIQGIQIDDFAGLRNAGIDFKDLAETGVDIFFTQVFRDHFFHADMHPGNLFVMPSSADGQPARYVPVDFGIMGSLSEFDQRYLADNFTALLNRDYRRVAELHVESGWVPPETRVDDLEFAVRTVCEPMFDRPIKEISIGQLLLRLLNIAQRFHVAILPQLILLQKTLVNVEGIGRQLYPDLDLWAAARPSLDRFLRERVGVRPTLKSLRNHAYEWATRLPELPGLIISTLDQVKSGKIQVETRDTQIAELRAEVRRVHRRLAWAIIGIGLLIIAVVQQGAFVAAAPTVASVPITVWVLGLLGIAAVVRSLRG
jgi:ubiquinone biosynthesis protein